MYAIQIKAEGEAGIVDYPADSSYEFLRDSVHGYIECLDFEYRGVQATLWLNEEGKLVGLPYNPVATQYVRSIIMPHDYIVGDVVLTGLPDEEGNTTGLTIEEVAVLIRL